MSKQLIFAALLIFFIVYSFVVYTNGTSYDKGLEYNTAQAKMGKLIFQHYNCISCHQIFGLGGYMGPDLTNMISRYEYAEQIAEAYLKTGTSKMPNFNLSQDEIDALIAYLRYLDESAVYPVRDYKAYWFGAVGLEEKK